MSRACYKPGSERGAWFELKCLQNTIAIKEARGLSAEFERGLYKSWIKYPEYAKADKENRAKGFYGELSRSQDADRGVSKVTSDVFDVPPIYETSNDTEVEIFPPRGITPDEPPPDPVKKRGRPRKSGEVSRVTAWRRQGQGDTGQDTSRCGHTIHTA